MKIGKTLLNIFKRFVVNDIKKRRQFYPDINTYRNILNIPYVDDGNSQHQYDVFFAKENKNNIAIIDIHGGAYIFGNRFDNFPYGFSFLEKGMDFISLDYQYSLKDEEILNLFKEVCMCFNHFVSHLKDYGLENRRFVIMGDSAGGHFALLLAEALLNKDIQKKLDIELLPIDVIGVVVASPVYDLKTASEGLSKSGKIRMFGRSSLNEEEFLKVSPNQYISSISVPIFHSFCKNDFIRVQCLELLADMKNNPLYQYYDVDSNDKNVDHVHNIVKLKLPESIEVNNKIVDFINKL